jgi:hypothetical protein
LFYFPILILGTILVLPSLWSLIYMSMYKKFTLPKAGRALTWLLIGSLALWVTLPSLKYMIVKEYDVVKGSCTIEIESSGRHSRSTFHMLDAEERISFFEVPELDAYGKTVPYYCEVTLLKDHSFEIGYKIYDAKSRELLQSSD